MVLDSRELLYVINRNVENLQESLDMQRCLVASLAGREIDTRNIKNFSQLCPVRTNEKILKEAVQETINELEESRKAFKSKRLETLRKKLISVLGECS
jgi:predicted nucleotide-binding protein (sugar kinase/HSP70/actin superfamily)